MSHWNRLKLQRTQNSVTRVVLEVPERTHADDLLRKLHWLLVKYTVDFKIAARVQDDEPRSAEVPIFQKERFSRATRSADQLLLQVPRDLGLRDVRQSFPNLYTNDMEHFTAVVKIATVFA